MDCRSIATRSALVAAGSLCLSACGDGGVSSTPTPPPAPPPATYTKLQDLTTTTTFNSADVHWQASSSGVTGQGADAFGNTLTVTFDPTTESYTINAPGPITATFSNADTDPLGTGGNVHSYVKTTSTGQQRLRVTLPTVGGVPLSYTLFGTFLDGSGGISRSWTAVGGAPTLASDMPKTGSATYSAETSANVVGGGTVYTTTAASTATFGVNFQSGAITTSIHLIGAPGGSSTTTDFGTFDGTGTISASGPGFTGSFAGTTGPGFTGAFFGPQAGEMGYVYNFVSGTFEYFGGTAGKKN